MNVSYQSRLKLLMMVCVIALSACSNRIVTAEKDMADIRNQPAQPVEPPPQPQIIADFIYSANELRSPFIPPGLMNLQTITIEDTGVRPDLNREKEPLEVFDLSLLVFRGMIVSPEGEQHGLVQRPDGSVTSVKVGNHMGLNDGRVVEITPTQINLIEIVPDSRAGFIERPQSLVSPIS